MKDLFYYQREVKSKEANGVNADGTPHMEEVIQTVWDCFNLNCVIRGHWVSEDTFAILLNDGHEQAEDVSKPVFKNGKVVNVELKRERSWVMSQIELKKEDAERLRKVTDINKKGTVELPAY